MVERKPEWPEAGDLLIATMEALYDYYAYIKMCGHGTFGRDK
jgi:hypothetical protein